MKCMIFKHLLRSRFNDSLSMDLCLHAIMNIMCEQKFALIDQTSNTFINLIRKRLQYRLNAQSLTIKLVYKKVLVFRVSQVRILLLSLTPCYSTLLQQTFLPKICFRKCIRLDFDALLMNLQYSSVYIFQVQQY